MALIEVLKPTWATWDDFHTEYVPWRKDYEASPASAGKFFSGGEILPDGSTVLEDYVYESFTASGDNASLPHNVRLYTDHMIPRSRTDMRNLYAFDHLTQKRGDLKGTRVRQMEFYKQYLSDIDKAKQKDPEEVDHWIDTFKKISPQLEDD